MRSVEEWIGKNDDQRIPDRVRIRVFTRYNGICHHSGRKITPSDHWQLDHILALVNGGEHRESNLAPILIDGPHQQKTVLDVAIKAKNDRVRKKHVGIKKPSRFPGARTSRFKKKIGGTVVLRVES